jgi:hypothetical protein
MPSLGSLNSSMPPAPGTSIIKQEKFILPPSLSLYGTTIDYLLFPYNANKIYAILDIWLYFAGGTTDYNYNFGSGFQNFFIGDFSKPQAQLYISDPALAAYLEFDLNTSSISSNYYRRLLINNNNSFIGLVFEPSDIYLLGGSLITPATIGDRELNVNVIYYEIDL